MEYEESHDIVIEPAAAQDATCDGRASAFAMKESFQAADGDGRRDGKHFMMASFIPNDAYLLRFENFLSAERVIDVERHAPAARGRCHNIEAPEEARTIRGTANMMGDMTKYGQRRSPAAGARRASPRAWPPTKYHTQKRRDVRAIEREATAEPSAAGRCRHVVFSRGHDFLFRAACARRKFSAITTRRHFCKRCLWARASYLYVLKSFAAAYFSIDNMLGAAMPSTRF